MLDSSFDKLSFNARLLLSEMLKRGIACEELGGTYVVRARHGEHTELLYDVYTAGIAHPLGMIIDDKYYAKQLLKHYGFSVPAGRVFTDEQKTAALDYATELGYPVVVKPTVGTHGAFVYVGNDSESELAEHIDRIVSDHDGNGHFVVEAHVLGNEYRLFVTQDGFFAAVKRTPAAITGDGKHTIHELVAAENQRRMHPRTTCLCTIELDDVVDGFLAKQGMKPRSVPEKGEHVALRQNSNVSTGGNCEEVTTQAHASFRTLARSVREKLDVPFIGLDILTSGDIAEPLGSYAICELNASPGLSLHMMPAAGEPQDTAAAVVDTLFPETKT